MMENSTSSAILLPKLYRAMRVFALVLALCGSVSAFAAKPVPANGKHNAAFATPAITSFAPKSGAPGTLLTVKGSGLAGALKVTLGDAQLLIISTTDTAAVAMILPTTVSGPVRVQTSAGKYLYAGTNFTVSATPYPSQQLGPKLADTTTYPNATFQHPENNPGLPPPHPQAFRYKNVKQGNTLAVSADGNTAVSASLVGLNYEYEGVFMPGGLTFYEKRNGAWVKSGFYFEDRSMGYAPFGITLSLNANGTVLLVTQTNDVYNAPVFVFEKRNGTWQKTENLGGATSAVISADGNTAVTGYAYYRATRGGADIREYASVWHRVNGSWVRDAPAGYTPPFDPLSNPDGTPAGTVDFGAVKMAGRDLAISADGKTMAATSTQDKGTFIMVYKGTKWVVQQFLPATSGSVSLSADGNILLQQYGIYTRTGSTWAKVQALPGTSQGAMTADGTVLMFRSDAGPVISTRNSAGVWVSQSANLSTSPAVSVAISADGTTAFSGYPDDTSVGQVQSKIYKTTYPNGIMTTDTSYRTDPYGSITAYSVTPPTTIASVSPTTGPVGTLVKVTGLSLDGATLTIGGKAAIVVSNTGTVITGMVMPGAATGAVTVTKNGAFAGGNFTVTATPYPLSPQSGALADTTVARVSPIYHFEHLLQQGASVAVSADGNSAVVAAAFGISDYQPRGGATFYKREDGVWKQDGPTIQDGTFGGTSSIAMNADGTRAVAGKETFREVGYGRSPVIMPWGVVNYNRVNGVWVAQPAEMVANTVALTADGNTLVAASFEQKETGGRNSQTIQIAHTSVYLRQGNTWVSAQDFVNPDQNIQLGRSVAISADGNIIALMSGSRYGDRFAPANAVGDNSSLTTYMYIKSGNTWVLQKKLATGGQQVLLNADGTVLVNAYSSGAVVSTRGTTSWTIRQTIPESGMASLSADGNVLMFAGTAGPVVYTRANGVFTKQRTIAPAKAGYAVALSADGTTAFMGNPNAGTVYTTTDFQGNPVETHPLGESYAYANTPLPSAPAGVATDIVFFPMSPDSIQFRFTNGSGSARAVFIKEGSTGFPTTVDGVVYTANPRFGQGTPAGEGWYCIYNGPHTRTDAIPTMAGLKPSTPYIIAIVEYNGNYGTEKYATSGATGKVTSDDLNIRASNVAFSNTTGTTTTLSWTNGSGVGRMVFISATTYDDGAGPSDTYYSPNTKYGSGNQINGYYCVYNGTGNSVNITGLASGQRYRAIVYDYNGSLQAPRIIRVQEVSGSAANMVTPVTAPTGYATGLAFSGTTATTTTLSWVSSNGAARAVFLKLGTSGALNVTNNTTYTANNTFGTGTQAGTNGWYCVYNGTGSSVNITGLSASSTYRAIVLEYNGGPGTEAYNLSRYNAANVTTIAPPMIALTTNQKRMLVEQDVLTDDATSELNVHQGVSPNGDGQNDVFTIDGIGAFPENTVKVLNSNGEAIYSATGYNNSSKAFDGHADNGTLQKAGTYFYTLEYKKGTEVIRKTGYLILKF